MYDPEVYLARLQYTPNKRSKIMTMDRNFTAHFTVTQGLKPKAKAKSTKTLVDLTKGRLTLADLINNSINVSARELKRLKWQI